MLLTLRSRIVLIFVTLCHTLIISQSLAQQVRIATFNCSMNRNSAGQLMADLQSDQNRQIQQVASIIRVIRPDVLLLNEFDEVENGAAVRLFQYNYLKSTSTEISGDPIEYPYFYVPQVNTGVPTGLDLDQDQKSDGPGDAFGFGRFPGQYGMVVLSKYPIQQDAVRTFQKLLWKDMPGALLPEVRRDGRVQSYYSEQATAVFRLSSKSHCDVPITIGTKTLHFLVSHPTPPAFDGDEDRNGRRNHDEIRLWKEYLDADASDWLRDDNGTMGGLPQDALFVIAGDQNADPVDGGSVMGAIQQLLGHPRIHADVQPSSEGAVVTSSAQAGANKNHQGPPATDTSDFNDQSVGNLRVDYVLPSKGFTVTGSGVFWPAPGTPGAEWVDCSDHRLVWVDLE